MLVDPVRGDYEPLPEIQGIWLRYGESRKSEADLCSEKKLPDKVCWYQMNDDPGTR